MSHFARLSASQSLWLVGTLISMLAMIGVGWYLEPKGDEIAVPSFSADQSIRQIAPEIGTTGFAMAKELHLSRKVNMDTAGNREQTTGASVLRGIRRTLDVNQRVWRIRGCAKGPALAWLEWSDQFDILEAYAARDRDAIDRRIVQQVRDGTGEIPDSEQDVGGYPELSEVHRAFDASQWDLSTMKPR